MSSSRVIQDSQRSPTPTSSVDRLRLKVDLRVGVGARLQAAEFVKEVGGSRAVLLCGGHFCRSHLAAELADAMGDALAATYVSTTAQSSLGELAEATEVVMEARGDVVLAIGGGSVMGLAKCVSEALADPGSFGGVVAEGARASGVRMPIVAMPTTAGSGSEANQYGSVQDPKSKIKIRVADYRLTPRITVLDPALTASMDRLLTAATGANALSHCFETVYSRAAHPLSTSLAIEAVALMADALPRNVDAPEDLPAREKQLVGSVMSSIAFSNSMLGLNAAFGHSLGLVADVPIAIGNYAMLPTTLRYNAEHAPEETLRVAAAMGFEVPDALTAANDVGDWLHGLAGPLPLRELLTTREVLDEVAEHVGDDVCLPYNPGPSISYDMVRHLLSEAW
jgi:alcohol dehydrogenase class IV